MVENSLCCTQDAKQEQSRGFIIDGSIVSLYSLRIAQLPRSLSHCEYVKEPVMRAYANGCTSVARLFSLYGASCIYVCFIRS